MTKGMRTCIVCGRDFALISEEHYIARDTTKKGLVSAITGEQEPRIYDAFDCPHCGCQNIIGERKRNFDVQLEALEALTSSEEVKCSDCKHFNVGINEEPCCKCTHGTLDLFEREETENE